MPSTTATRFSWKSFRPDTKLYHPGDDDIDELQVGLGETEDSSRSASALPRGRRRSFFAAWIPQPRSPGAGSPGAGPRLVPDDVEVIGDDADEMTRLSWNS